MNFSVVGTSYKFATIEIREKIAFVKRRLPEANNFFGNVVILSTCNRVEIYTDMALDLRYLLCRYHEVNLMDYLYRYEGEDAFRHLCRVASGLDSLLFGEKEILGQVRYAYNIAKPKGLLNKMFIDAFRVARKIRKRLVIDSSISKTVKEFLGPVYGKKVVVIGRGEVGRSIAEMLGAEIVSVDRLRECLESADIVISATGSPHIVIKKEDVPEGQLLILDLAIPRDVDPRVTEIPGVKLYNLDEICGGLVQEEAGLQLSR